MKFIPNNRGPQITVAGDNRITKVGKFLRKYKVDEFPQLINIIKGEMSFIGPRPEIWTYVNIYRSDYEKLLKVRPGITDPASMEYSEEEILLSQGNNWEEIYIENVLPHKIRYSLKYMKNCNMLTDFRLIYKTIGHIWKRRSA